ncbi:MAG: lysophospholipid acyltransferase family protein [Kofleriaceae bacterium]
MLDAIGRARLARESVAGRGARLHAACAEIASIHGLEVSIEGSWPAGPFVIVANHVSYLDAIAIASVLPCAPIAKSEVERWPMIGLAARELGVIFVARDSAWSRVRALRRAHAVLRDGLPVLNFPEGTTTDGTKLLPFQRGIFGLARHAGVPVLPVAVHCAPHLAWHGNAPFLPHYVAMARLAAPEVRLELGRVIDPTQLASAEEVAALAHHRIAHMLRDQLEPHATVIRLRVPAPRSNPVLPASYGRLAR